MRLRLAGLTASIALALCSPDEARAYCRTRTTDPPQSACPDQCSTDGAPLRWLTSDIHYAPNDRGFPGLNEADLRGVLAASVQTWANVSCNGVPVALRFTAEPSTPSRDAGWEGTEPDENVNIVALLSSEEWRLYGMSSAAYAITSVWFEKPSGEIVGSDMMFNGGIGQFTLCPEAGCPPESGLIDLQNVATHEFGHFLGLAHSDVPGSTMWCGASAEEIEKRTLTEDDIAGLCEAYSDPNSFVLDRHYHGGGSCSAFTRRAASSAWPFTLLMGAFALLLRGRRKHARLRTSSSETEARERGPRPT